MSVPVVFTSPTPLSDRIPLEVRFTAAPPPALTVPVMFAAPVLPTVIVPPPVWPIAAIVSAAVFVSATLPPVVLAALNVPTVFAPLSV